VFLHAVNVGQRVVKSNSQAAGHVSAYLQQQNTRMNVIIGNRRVKVHLVAPDLDDPRSYIPSLQTNNVPPCMDRQESTETRNRRP
jgi:hypothetical protein